MKMSTLLSKFFILLSLVVSLSAKAINELKTHHHPNKLSHSIFSRIDIDLEFTVDDSHVSELNLNTKLDKLGHKPTRKELCNFCYITMPILRSLLEKNETQYFTGIATYICVKLKLADEIVCNLAIKAYQVNRNTNLQMKIKIDLPLVAFKALCDNCGQA